MRISIGHKIFSIAAVLVVLMIVAAGISVNLISKVKDQLDVVSHTQLPVSEAVARITVRILEQGIVLQRFFVLSEEVSPDAALLESTSREYDAFTTQIGLEFDAARNLMKDHDPDSHAHTQIYKRLLPVLNTIADHYAAFLKEADVLKLALEVGDRETFEVLLPELDLAQDALDREVIAFRSALEGLVEAATAKADEDEILALQVNVGLTVIAVLLGLIFAALITRVLVRSVRNLVAGAQAVEEGDLDSMVAKTSSDEIGSLTDSFNHMIGELRLKERIKDTFGKYMDPRIVTRLLDRPEISEPGGERRNMTVMFIDLKGFTSISEKLSPHDLVRMINRFFNHMTEAIADNNGVVDKFMGDAVMAFWGPPFTSPEEHGTLASKAALAAVAQLDRFRAELIEELGEEARTLDIDLRVGVSTGAMIVGTVGSDVSKSYTVVGDPVNLGSRLEGANKAYGTHILVAEETQHMAKQSGLLFREIDLLRVKGKNEPVRIFELIASESKLGQDECREFERGLAAYRAKDWDSSEAAFKVVLAAIGTDPASQTYIDRISHFRNAPPPADWDGVWVLEEK